MSAKNGAPLFDQGRILMMPPTYKIAGGRKDKPLFQSQMIFSFLKIFFLDQKGIKKEERGGEKKKKKEKEKKRKERKTYSTREGKNALTGARK